MSKTAELMVAKQPQQRRSREKVTEVRKAAEKIILEESLEACTIAALSEKTGYPRATIYMFYPAPLALFNDLAAIHIKNMQTAIVEQAEYIGAGPDWRNVTARVVHVAGEYFRNNPVAGKLALGPLSDSSHRAWENTLMHLGKKMEAMLRSRGVKLRESETDTCTLIMEFGISSFRYSYFVHGYVTPAYEKAAIEVMLSFLNGYVVFEP